MNTAIIKKSISLSIKLLILFIGLPNMAYAQKMTAEQFFVYIQNNDKKEKTIMQGLNDAKEYFDNYAARKMFVNNNFSQADMDLMAIRFQRMMRSSYHTMKGISNNTLQYIRRNQNNVIIDPIVIKEGIAKYTEKTNIHLEAFNESHREYTRLYKQYIAKYGNIDREIFKADDNFMKQYGVIIYD